MIKNQRGNTVLAVLISLVVFVGIGAAGYKVWKHQHKQTVSNTTSKTAQDATNPTNSGATNSDLNNDLNNVTNAIDGENSDQTNANTTLNDQQSQVSIPTY